MESYQYMSLMNQKDQVIHNPPNTGMLADTLRDTGYEHRTAICDVIDNSVAWGSKKIIIEADMDVNGNVTISIADDGMGMDNDELKQAMTYGSNLRIEREKKGKIPSKDSPTSLSKFGIGLKTASTSMCRRLSLISTDGKSELIRVTWDMDHINKVNDWEMLSGLPTNEQKTCFDKVAKGQSGTVVYLENFDRFGLERYQDRAGIHARNALDKIKNEMKDYIAKVYQRYLDKKSPYTKRNIDITFNGEKIEPWDPFVEELSEMILEKNLGVSDAHGKDFGEIHLAAWLLPRPEDFSTPELAKRAYGKNNRGTDKQGIYVYRENRLIRDASWLKLFSKEPHINLLRVDFSFQSKLDDAFNIDMKKSKISIDTKISEEIKKFLTPVRREADTKYRGRQNKKIKEKADNAHDSSNRNISSKEKEINQSTFEILDKERGKIKVTNQEGIHERTLVITDTGKTERIFVNPVTDLEGKVLWEPGIVDGRIAVNINTSHDYYGKVYVPNHNDSLNMQGLGSLFWALSNSELNCTDTESKENFEEMRHEVSKTLRKLVSDLPDPNLNDEDK